VVKIIAFGNNSYYSKLAEDLLTRIKYRYPDYSYELFTENEIPKYMVDYAQIYKRGFGYWIWKPYILKIQFEKLNPGDVVVYIDSRTSFTGQRIKWIDEFVKSDCDIGIWQIGDLHGYTHKEFQFSTKKLMDFLEATEDDINSNQIVTTLFCIRINANSKRLINEWHSLHRDYPQLCRDDDVEDPNNYPGFIDSRSEQSTFSLIVKKELRSKKITAKIFSNQDIHNKESVRIHFWPHEGKRFAYFVSILRLKFPGVFRFFRPIYFIYLRILVKKKRNNV
jgi:hypothetical protein